MKKIFETLVHRFTNGLRTFFTAPGYIRNALTYFDSRRRRFKRFSGSDPDIIF